MGLSLSVLVALMLLLPGAAFVFAATRLHSSAAPATGLEQQITLSLAVALVAAITGHLLMLAALHVVAGIWPTMHRPDLFAVVQLLGGTANGEDSAISRAVSEHPFCVGSYILAAAGLMWGVGRSANRYIQTREPADWYQLLRPAEVGFVVLTADFAPDGEAALYKGVVDEFNTSRTGDLEWVVLAVAARKAAVSIRHPLDDMDEAELVLGHGWVEMPGERVVLQMRGAKTVTLDYFWASTDAAAASDHTNSDAQTPTAAVANV